MAASLSFLSQFIWHERFWMPIGVSWKDFEMKIPGVYFPKLGDLVVQSFALGIILLGIRHLLER